jgi:ABC-type branched-subunit amino acid transport system ATPase component
MAQVQNDPRVIEVYLGDSVLAVAQLNQYYGGSHILRDVSFEVPAGKVTALLGRNGVGKTTLLRTLMGVIPAKTGTIRFGERTSPRRSRTSACARASATCRRVGRSFRA